MGKPLILSRKDVSARIARAAQFMADAAAVTVTITWADEQQDTIAAETHQATAYGETSAGRPIGSLPGELPVQIAVGHLGQVQKVANEGAASLLEQVAKAKEADEKARAEAGEGESEENDPMVAAAVEAVAELSEPHEEANADAHE